MIVDYQQFNLKLATLQENHPDMNIQEVLDTSVNNIIETSPTSILEENYINLYDTELSKLIETLEPVNTSNGKKPAKKGTLPVDKAPTKSSNRISTRSKEIRQPLVTLASIAPNFIKECTNIDTNFFFILEAPSDKVGYIGIWYVTSKTLYKLISSKLKVLRVIVTNVNSKDKRYSYLIEITSNKGAIEQFTLTSFELERGKLKSVLAKYSDRYPPTKYLEGLLIDAIQILASKEDVLIQVEEEELGYHTLSNGEKVYLLTNGIETVNGFIPLDKSPLIAPSIPDTANGYKGKEVCSINDEIMKELFCNLNTNGEVQTIMLALLGASCIVSYPIGDYAGTLPYAIEIIGENGLGKTPLLNYMLSFFGIDFNRHKATLYSNSLSEGDTSKARGKRLSKLKFMMFADSDNQDTPNIGKKFEATYAMRNKTNVAIANRDGRSSLSITREERYDEPVNGSLVRTGNFDFALISIERDNTPTEKRSCTFIWPIGAYSNREISKLINRRREEYYVIGALYRNWCMQKSDNELLELFEEIKEIAETLVDTFEWTNDDTYREHTIAFLIGLHLFIKFLKDVLPTSFMVQWVSEHVPALIENRVARTNYIFGDLHKQVEIDLVQHVLTAIVIQFANGSMYVHNQNDKQYKSQSSTDIPFCGIDRLGYRQDKPQGMLIGYVIGNGEYIAFKKKELYNQIQRYSKLTNYNLPSMKIIEEALFNAGYIATDDKGKVREVYKISKSSMRLIGISLLAIHPDTELEEGDITGKVIDIDEKRKAVENIVDTIIDLDETF